MSAILAKKPHPDFSIFSTSGQALILVLFVSALMGIVMSSYVFLINNQQKSEVSTQLIIARSLIETKINAALNSDAYLKAASSYASNTAFTNCYQPLAATCNTIVITGFALTDPTSPTTLISGSASLGATEVRYDTTGNLCTTASVDCLFKVYTSFSATCFPTSPCSNPIMKYRYDIIQDQTSSIGTTFKKITVNNIGATSAAPSGPHQCNSSSFATGMNADGSMICSSYDPINYARPCAKPSDCTASGSISGTPCTVNFGGGWMITKPYNYTDLMPITIGTGPITGETYYSATGGSRGMAQNRACCIMFVYQYGWDMKTTLTCVNY